MKSLSCTVIRIVVDDLDLVEQYFLRDLTEDEKKSLDELMERSPEAAQLFVEKSKAVHQPQALPEIKLPPSLPPLRQTPVSLSKWLWVLAGYGLLAGAFWIWTRNHDIHWPWDQPEQAPFSEPAVSPAQNIPKTASRNLASPLVDGTGTDNDIAQAMGAQPTPEDEDNGFVTPVPATALSPSALEHAGLRVIVNRPIPALVTVTVLNTTGKEIRTLYSGALQAGQWAFEWNGRLANGDKAPIGAYTLQVQSGSTVQKQEVWIGQ